MKAAELVELIREEVKKAVREELADLLKEAVTAASTPQTVSSNLPFTSRDVTANEIEAVQKSVSSSNTALKPLDQLLEETRLNFTAADAKMFTTSAQRDMHNLESRPAVAVATQLGMTAGVDITQLPFVKKAKEVLDLSYQKDKSRGN